MSRLLFFSSLFLIGFNACRNSNDADYAKEVESKLPTNLVHNPNSLSTDTGKVGCLTFIDSTHHFGKVKEGEKVTYDFAYKNTGSKDLLIFSAKASCGCTVPEYNSTTPLKPGEERSMKVTFNSAGKKGHNHKAILVTNSGVPGEVTISIDADVE